VGLASFLYRLFYGLGLQPRGTDYGIWNIPGLSQIPVIGPMFFQQSPLVYLTYLIIAVSFIVIFRSSWGLSIIATGENPAAAETLGVNVVRTRYISMVISGALCGIGGAFLSLVATSVFLDNMTAGRGYIALAILLLGRRNPLGLLAAALMFGAADALQLRTQLLNIGIPFQFMLMLPYLLTIVVLSFFVRRTDNPAALGEHFKQGGGES